MNRVITRIFFVLLPLVYNQSLSFVSCFTVDSTRSVNTFIKPIRREQPQRTVTYFPSTARNEYHTVKLMTTMTNISLDRQALQVTMICSAVVALKMLVGNIMIGMARIEGGTRPPEDAPLFPENGAQGFSGRNNDDDKKQKEATEMEQRCIRIGLNDLENIPITLILNWGCLFVCYSTRMHIVLNVAFAVGRVLHHVFYYKKLQPHRALAWTLALFATLGFGINGVLGAFLTL